MKQTTFASSGFKRYAKPTRRAAFLAEMDRVVPWQELCTLIEPVYPKAGNGSTLRYCDGAIGSCAQIGSTP